MSTRPPYPLEWPKGPMVLWGNAQARSGRCLWAFEELKDMGVPAMAVDFGHKDVATRSAGTHGNPTFMALNHAGKIPVLQDGDLVMNESAAIINYLGDKARALGATKSLTPPPGTPARARYDAWCFFIMAEIDSQGLYMHRKHVGLKETYGEAPVAVKSAEVYYKQRMADVTQQLKLGGGPWLMGPDFSGADILLGHCCTWGAQLGWFPWDDEVAFDYIKRVVSRPAWRKILGNNNMKSILEKVEAGSGAAASKL